MRHDLPDLLDRTDSKESIKLLWDEESNDIYISVEEHESGDILIQQVPSDSGMDAFNHPYIYLTEPEVIYSDNQTSESLVERIAQYSE